jgi:hypothetical protein
MICPSVFIVLLFDLIVPQQGPCGQSNRVEIMDKSA